MVRARIQQLDGRLDDAIASSNQVLRPDPLAAHVAPDGRIDRTERHRLTGRGRLSARAIALDPGQSSARLELVRLYGLQQRLAELDEQFVAIARRNPLDFDYVRFWFMT